ncbi:MAG: crossover junction endodeoxyribonuclease RuvC [Alphaproteobacteria bacterium]
MTATIRILGVDPGLRATGWGVVSMRGNTLSFEGAGTVRPPVSGELAARLCALHDGLAAVVKSWTPDLAAVEKTFVNRNGAATLKLGQARGIALLVPAMAGLSVAEYAPNVVKKTVVGAGHADKQQIRAMVQVLLPRAVIDSDDAADALAIAITHAHHHQQRLSARIREVAS